MSKKIYLLLFSSVFLNINLNLNAMVTDKNINDQEKELIQNVDPVKQKFYTGSILRIEKPAGFKERSVGAHPEVIQILGSDDSNTGISVVVPEVNLNINIPEGANVTPLSRPGLEGVKIKLADGKFVNIFLPNLVTLPSQQSGSVIPLMGSSNNIAQAAATQAQAQVEQMINRMENLYELNGLLERYHSNLTLVKKDPKFKEIKPILKQTYDMISSIPFLLSIGTGALNMFKVQVEETITKKANIEGFEEITEDIQDFTDHTFIYGDKFMEFLRKFSKHFVDNKIVKELLAD